MQEEPRDWHHLQSKNMWPDRIIYKDTPEGQTLVMFIIDKGNNRALTTDREFLVRLLEQAGLNIRLSYAGQLMTLDEFNSGQGYRLSTSGWARQAYYNAKTDLTKMEQIATNMSIEDPGYPALARQIDMLRKRLAANSPIITAPKPATSPLPLPEVDDNATRLKRRQLIWNFKMTIEKMGLPKERVDELFYEGAKLERISLAQEFVDKWLPIAEKEANELKANNAFALFEQESERIHGQPSPEGGTSQNPETNGGPDSKDSTNRT